MMGDVDRRSELARTGGRNQDLVDSAASAAYGDPSVHAPEKPQHTIDTIFEKGRPGRRAFVAPKLDVPEKPKDELLPARFQRKDPP
jgi:hypothetical protein